MDNASAYDKSRQDLIQYEDSEFARLIANVPNFYLSKNDQTIWGAHLRSIAKELGRLEYYHAYDIVGKDMRYLTPADVRRQWGDPLFINKNYPSTLQYDLDYKNLAMALQKAFTQGATVESISEVLTAYTGQKVKVDELFKEIGKTADISDRNRIRVSVRGVGFTNTENVNESVAKLQSITSDLYGAIDKAKPAHIGVDLLVTIGPAENIGDYITGRYGITDTLRIIAVMEENPEQDALYQAPFLEKHPDTGLGGGTIVYVSPISGDINQVVNVYGVGFTGVASVKLNGKPCVFTVLSDAQLIFTVPGGAKTGAIVITTAANVVVESNIDFIVKSGPVTYMPKPGVMSPVINKVWEIKTEKTEILDLD
jgi:hypothetical protein